MQITENKHRDYIYKEVINFCKKRGLIKKLKDSFLVPEEKRFHKKNIDKIGLGVLDAVHCVYDKKRTDFFIMEIEKNVSNGNIVIEAGIGTGILSFYAASLGATVYGCEINPAVFTLANNIKDFLEKKELIPKSSVKFFLHDAITFVPPQKADILISENIYTGMFFEYQVQIVRHLNKYLKKQGEIIPQAMHSSVTLAQVVSDTQLKNKELLIPSKETKTEIKSKPLSMSYVYDDINFIKIDKLQANYKNEIKTTNTGKINAVMIQSDVKMPSGKVIKSKDTDFLNNKIYITLNPSIEVRKGEVLNLNLSYTYGQKVKAMKILIKKRGNPR